MPTLSPVLFKLQKPPMSLKQFMLRSEVIKLYRGFMKLSRLMDPPPASLPTSAASTQLKQNAVPTPGLAADPLKVEWINWVRAEFRLRQTTTDEEAIKMMIAHGKRQLQEMERTILLATNRNLTSTTAAPSRSTTSNKTSNSSESAPNRSDPVSSSPTSS